MTDEASGSVSVLDAEAEQSGSSGLAYGVSGTFAAGSGPAGVSLDPSTDTVYVADSGSGSVSVMSGRTNSETALVTVGYGPDGVDGGAVDEATGTVYVANTLHDDVSVVDASTDTVADTIDVGSAPEGVAVDTADGSVYVTDASGGASSGVSVIDGSTDTVETTIALGTAPEGVAVDEATDTVYVANSAGTAVIDGATDAVTGTIAGAGADTESVACDQATSTVYVIGSLGAYPGNVQVVDGANVTDPADGGEEAVGASSPVTVGGLTDGDAYTFSVQATNGIGVGAPSSPSAAVTPLGYPGAPGAPSATAGDAEATVSWAAPADGGSPITEYVVLPYAGSTPQAPVVDPCPCGGPLAALTIAKAPSATTLSLSSKKAAAGSEQKTTFSVKVRAGAHLSGTPAGSVEVEAGTTRVCTVKLASGKGSCRTRDAKLLKEGTYRVVARYAGNADFKASQSAKSTLVVSASTTSPRRPALAAGRGRRTAARVDPLCRP